MLSYIATEPESDYIEQVCKKLNITILSHIIGKVDFLKYIKETKVNFKLIKYMIIDLKSLKDTEEKQIDAISYFNEIYPNIRIIILASGYDEQNLVLTTLYEKGLYNIINEKDINEKLEKSLSIEGLSKRDAKKFKRIEETKVNKYNKLKEKIVQENLKKREKNTQIQVNSSIYFVTLFIKAITKLLELIGVIIIFGLTSLGLTILFNEPLRNMVFEIFK